MKVASSWPKLTRPLSLRDLRTDAVYVSPRGRLCKAISPQRTGPGSGGWMFEFRYLDRHADGFWLTEPNLRIMRVDV